MSNRQEVEAFIIKYIGQITPGTNNADNYKKLFASMNDKDFDAFMVKLESGEIKLSVIIPNFSKNNLTLENNLKVADSLGHNFFQKLWIEGKDDQPTYLTPIPYMVVDLPVKRASQLLDKKISVPKTTKVVDAVTGQVTGEAKGAKISYPELQLAASMGLEDSMIELIKYRGGDNRGGAALAGLLARNGNANLSTLSQFASGVESTKSLKTFLTAAHLKSNLTG